jgi:hypothetical protein
MAMIGMVVRLKGIDPALYGKAHAAAGDGVKAANDAKA